MWNAARDIRKPLEEVDKGCAEVRRMEHQVAAVIHLSDRASKEAFLESFAQLLKRCNTKQDNSVKENKCLVDDIKKMKKDVGGIEASQEKDIKIAFGKLLEWGEENCYEPCCCEESCNEE